MANFFKDYQKTIKEKRLAEIKQEQDRKAKETAIQNYIDGLKVGQKIKHNYHGKTETAYFISDANTHIWFSDTKENAKNGFGWTIPKNYIIIKG